MLIFLFIAKKSCPEKKIVVFQIFTKKIKKEGVFV